MKDYRVKIKQAVADGYSDAVEISEVTLIRHPQVNRLLNLMAQEPGSGIIKTRRGRYQWDTNIKKPKVKKDKPVTFLGIAMSWFK